MNYDLIIIGSGPGGYVAAIRASQLGMKVGVVEKSELGGICLNWGCIPTKSLLKSGQVFTYTQHAADYGVVISGDVKPDFEKMIQRSRGVADGMSKGIQFLFKKNKIEHIQGFGVLKDNKTVEVTSADGKKTDVYAEHIIIATGARSKELPNLKQDGKKIIGYREAMTLPKQPKSMIVVGSGAIGSEFANFYNSIGTDVTLVEFLPNIVPNEDEEVSKQLGRSFKKAGIKVMVDSSVESVDTSGNTCKVTIKTKKGVEVHEAEIVLSAVGVTPNIENIGLEKLGIGLEKGKIKVDDYYKTNIPGIYAIGDIVHGPALAHVASAEGIVCVEKIKGLNPEPVDYKNIPACTYTSPEIASVGLTEQAAKDAGFEIKTGKFPFTASGKASAAGEKDGFVKLIFDAKYGELLGAHLIGANVTEMIAELVVARKLETTGHELMKSVHPHPTMSEAIMEAAAAAYDEVIHL
ncbi:MAG: dihydrolipoyl dehydrogenase [Bacteroidetes bacterium GWC2_33_15]|nr:MAG: dihydrolipoyl dehydrogenase [Bacteroidetes bacterium GWA2_33_15]OFX50021.1 MAG: dihydrolipoyl dehydrogenase [Bacteroidetes bacterium GWC2_33_15]OFX65175.1 MAG: dihydrolipoyl dehydrogenase [Bacteroidetes bacterium GWB2_32_14]OFX70400.1 MAG: dihydrolipoyl dehydrogenase [Bacteroidetes bacterium GWD2_33_33]HAN19732.1 dihydrolipoyl dehydrogenase [Bacteroidales bacterium]